MLAVKVERQRHDQQPALRDLLPEGLHANHVQPGFEALEHKHPQKGAEDRADAAGEGRAAQNGGRDGVKLKPVAGRRLPGIHARGQQHAGESGKPRFDDVQLEDDIRTILSALGTIKNASELVELEYEALRIDEKFDAENFILKNETQMQVVTYYRYIEKVFSNSNADFDMIASEIKVSSMKLEKAGLSQQDVIRQLSEWIRNKAGLGTESLLACNIVVSFFIQNCEVFHK